MPEFKRTSDRAAEISRKIRSGEIQVTYARSTRVNDLRKWIDKVLDAVGHPEAFVTDLSTFSDFWARDERDEQARKTSKKLGLRVEPSDCIVDAASRLRLASLQ